jgi:hypothetical protein
MVGSNLCPGKREKAFPNLKLRFWGGRNSVMGGGLLAEAFMSSRRYRNLRAEGKKVRDARKAAIVSADENNGGENAMSPTSIDEKTGGAQNPGEGGDQGNKSMATGQTQLMGRQNVMQEQRKQSQLGTMRQEPTIEY